MLLTRSDVLRLRIFCSHYIMEDCIICYGVIGAGCGGLCADGRRSPCCGQWYHYSCSANWYDKHNTCPTCGRLKRKKIHTTSHVIHFETDRVKIVERGNILCHMSYKELFPVPMRTELLAINVPSFNYTILTRSVSKWMTCEVVWIFFLLSLPHVGHVLCLSYQLAEQL